MDYLLIQKGLNLPILLQVCFAIFNPSSKDMLMIAEVSSVVAALVQICDVGFCGDGTQSGLSDNTPRHERTDGLSVGGVHRQKEKA